MKRGNVPTSAGSTHERSHRARLDISVYIMEQPASTARDGDVVVDILPGERLAVELGDGAILFLSNGCLLADGLAPAPTLLPPFAEPCVPLLGLVVFGGVDSDGRAAVEVGEVLDEEDLGDLEQDQESDDDEEVAPPDVRHIQPETEANVVAAADDLLSGHRTKERANLVGAKTVSAEDNEAAQNMAMHRPNLRILVESRWIAGNDGVAVTSELLTTNMSLLSNDECCGGNSPQCA